MSADLAALAPFHLIHVGGIGMSALARILVADGIPVSGSDPKETGQTIALRALGVPVAIPGDVAAIPAGATIVVSSATRPDNPELIAARERGLVVLHRSQLLALLVRGHPTIAVSGTHGKTTTTAMIVHILRTAGLDPTFIVGSELVDPATNAQRGSGDWSIVEADESDGSLLSLAPDVAVLTNLEPEHLDHYAGIEELTETMRAWIAGVQPDGCVVACVDDPGARAVIDGARTPTRTYGFDAGDARLVRIDGTTVLELDGSAHRLELAAPGAHNARNAAAAVLAAQQAGVDPASAVRALATFTGTRRRFEAKGTTGSIRIIDDYAHHPTEIAATLQAARDVTRERGRIIALFEPHLYSRTMHLGADMGAALAHGADLVAILPIDGSREADVPSVTSRIVLDGALAAEPRRIVAWCANRDDAVRWVMRHADDDDLILTIGAGGITTLGPELLSELEKRR